jgi:predicted anti-sigma-YlaC factor YlaD
VKVNILAVIGAFLGIFVILLPWLTSTVDFGNTASVATKSLTDQILHEQDTTFAAAGVIFLFGSAFALITTIAGVIQLAGTFVYVGAVASTLGTRALAPSVTQTDALGVGFFLGVLAGIITLIGLARPVSISATKSNETGRSRLLTWTD